MSYYSEDVVDEEKLSCDVSFKPEFDFDESKSSWKLEIEMHCMRRDNVAAIQLIIGKDQIHDVAKSLAILVQMMLLEAARAEVSK